MQSGCREQPVPCTAETLNKSEFPQTKRPELTMKFSANWLKQWVKVDLDAAQWAERLTAAGGVDFRQVLDVTGCRAR